jgi:hypothetical protein
MRIQNNKLNVFLWHFSAADCAALKHNRTKTVGIKTSKNQIVIKIQLENISCPILFSLLS